LSSQSKSGAIDQLTLGDRPVDRDRRVGHPCFIALHFLTVFLNTVFVPLSRFHSRHSVITD